MVILFKKLNFCEMMQQGLKKGLVAVREPWLLWTHQHYIHLNDQFGIAKHLENGQDIMWYATPEDLLAYDWILIDLKSDDPNVRPKSASY